MCHQLKRARLDLLNDAQVIFQSPMTYFLAQMKWDYHSLMLAVLLCHYDQRKELTELKGTFLKRCEMGISLF